MTTRDRDLQRAIDDATAELAARLRPRLIAGVDADDLAAAYLDWLAGRGLHLIPPPPVTTGRYDPEATRRGAQLARDAFEQARKTRGDQH